MIVCICCNINEQTIIDLLDRIKKPSDVHGLCDQCLNCGKCLPTIKEMIDENSTDQNSQQTG